MPERHQKWRNLSPMLILLLSAWLRAVSLTAQGLWRDEVDQWRFALQPWGAMVANFTRAGWNGPLYSPLLRGWIALAGDSVYAMRYFSLLWGVLAVALLYALTRRLRGVTVALWAAVLLAGSPYWVWYAQEIKMYTWMPMLVLLALYALDRALTRPSAWWWAVVGLATTLAIYSHLLAALLIPVEVGWFLLHPRRHPRAWRGGLIVLALLTLPYVPLLRWQLPLLFRVRQTGFPPYTLGEMCVVLFNSWTTGMLSYVPPAVRWQLLYQLFFGGTSLLGLGSLLLRRRRLSGQLLLWLSVPLLTLWLVSLRGPIFTDRYLIWLSPAFYILAAQGLRVLSGRSSPWLTGLLLGMVLLLDGGADYGQAVTAIKPQFDRAADFLVAQRQPDEPLLFQIPYNHYVLAYYLSHRPAPRPLDPWLAAPYTNWREPDGSYRVGAAYVDRQMRSLVGNSPVVWLVYSEVSLWDDRELVKAWLDTHGTAQTQSQYHGVRVFRYALAP